MLFLVAIFVCCHENGGLAEKFSIYFLLTKTHSTVWAKTIALDMLFKNKSYPSGVCLSLTFCVNHLYKHIHGLNGHRVMILVLK